MALALRRGMLPCTLILCSPDAEVGSLVRTLSSLSFPSDGQFRRSWNARSTLSSEKFFLGIVIPTLSEVEGEESGFLLGNAEPLVSLGMTTEKMF